MKLYGHETCSSCKTIQMMLTKYGVPYEFIDVSKIPGFTGVIPQLELDDGATLIGAGDVMRWINKQWRR